MGGRYTTMRLDVTKNTNFANLKVKAATEAATGPAGVAAVGAPVTLVEIGRAHV